MALLEVRHDVTVRTPRRPAAPAAPDLRIVSRFGVGYDTVDIPACTRRGVVVSVTNGGNDLSVAEHALMLLLAVASSSDVSH